VNEILHALLLLPPQASRMSRDIDALHYLVISLTMASTAVVFAATAIFMVRYRRVDGPTAVPRFETKRWLELTVAASILVTFLFLWAVGFKQYVRMETPPDGTLDIYVTAKQWMWKFSYADGVNAIAQVTVPANKPVRLIMTSRDVIHSFYVPALRMKQDVIPGRYVTLWFEADRPGTYPVFCAEYCGTSHSGMLGSVVVLTADEYARWHEAAAGAKDGPKVAMATDRRGAVPMADRGREVATKRACLACHTLDGQRTMGPSFGGLYLSTVPLEGGRSVTADEAYLTKSMMEPGADVVLGFQNAMPTYQGLLPPEEVGALVELIKSVRVPAEPAGVPLPELEKKP
jgi:cytochrome c oxidase subunit 2